MFYNPLNIIKNILICFVWFSSYSHLPPLVRIVRFGNLRLNKDEETGTT